MPRMRAEGKAEFQVAGETARRTQAARRGESDRRMLRAATRLFARQGVAGTSLAEVGVAAGYSRGLPVERFGSKRGLIEALLDSMAAWFETRVAASPGGRRGVAAVIERIDAHVDGARRSPLATAALYAVYVESLGAAPALRPRVNALIDKWRADLAARLREGQRDGEIRDDIDCAQQAAIILGALRGLVIEHLMGDTTTDLDAIRDALVGLVRATLPAGEPAGGARRRRAGRTTGR
ncbi:MAG: TetR/AcrR family transcriptional regulator [Rhodospirillales bacterium]|nr:MAG: TetR/AcrR family transcriptional regulator [Rhodospirillales bacterium]